MVVASFVVVEVVGSMVRGFHFGHIPLAWRRDFHFDHRIAVVAFVVVVEVASWLVAAVASVAAPEIVVVEVPSQEEAPDIVA